MSHITKARQTAFRMQARAEGEEIEVRDGGGAAPRKVVALVTRMAAGASDARTGLPMPKCRITVVSDPARGITPSQSNQSGATRVLIPYPDRHSTPREMGLHPPSDGRPHESGGIARFDAK